MMRPSPLPLSVQRAASENTLVMGVVNVTADSFSDGGNFLATDAAIAHGKTLFAEGAAIVDVGGEATGPGTERTPLAVERERVIPVVKALTSCGIPVSVDTMRAKIAAEAIAAGALIINDVSGGRADRGMAAVIAESGVVYVAMHWRGLASQFANSATYNDIVCDVRTEIAQSLAVLDAAGVGEEQIVVDPGLGFSKDCEHNWPLLARIKEWSAGFPVLIGASRKRFVGAVLATAGVSPPPAQRDGATAAISALCAREHVWCVRVHDVASSVDAVRVGAAWREEAK